MDYGRALKLIVSRIKPMSENAEIGYVQRNKWDYDLSFDCCNFDYKATVRELIRAENETVEDLWDKHFKHHPKDRIIRKRRIVRYPWETTDV